MIRIIEPGEEGLLEEIDQRADRLVEPFGYWPLPDTDPLPGGTVEHAVTFVAGRPPVGFAEVDVVDGTAHLAQLSVLPEHGRQGIGRALVEAACDWARGAGHDAITLTTFADIPFNAPWYRRLGFEEMRDPGPGLQAVIRSEAPLEALGTRVTMRRRLWEDRGDER
ncbi:MAG TPA: GNAT family N-acetyltransferase [Acidimicrobiales bacterium]|nr:GNAT family N-acetyltransferase [Acidimicrobiales bacterium]